MENCRFCSKPTPNTRIWKLGSRKFISPFCDDECKSEYEKIKQEIGKQKK